MRAVRDSKGRYINYRKRQAVCRKIITLTSALVLSALIAVGAFYVTSNAKDLNEDTYCKLYTSITVYPGDTLSSLYMTYGDGYDSLDAFIHDVSFTNHMTDDCLIAGQSLIVPYYALMD